MNAEYLQVHHGTSAYLTWTMFLPALIDILDATQQTPYTHMHAHT